MRWLQVLVAAMSIMIVIGVTVIGVTIAHRLSTHLAPSLTQTAQTPVQSVLKLPSGAHVLSVTNGGDRVVLRIAGPDQLESLYILDTDSGRLLHQIMLDNR